MDNKEYKPLTIPKLQWVQKTLSSSYGELMAQPLEPGFGLTLGNALRRILLGAVEGSAVTSVIIKHVNNEFSIIPGVVEDTMQLVLNIKELIIRNKTGKPGTMTLRVKGEATARASAIVAESHLEVVNGDHVLAHVAADGELEIQFFVEPGRGYEQAKWPADKALQEDGRIYLDAMFSPLRKVSFDVAKARVGDKIDYDHLSLVVSTNGAETPVNVVHYAVSVLRTQLEHFLKTAEIPFNDISVVPVDEPVVKQGPEIKSAGLKGVSIETLLRPIEDLELSVRAHNCLISAGITRIVDLVNLSEDAALKIKNFGRKSLNEVKDSMRGFGLTFGMDINEDEVRRLSPDSMDDENE